MDEKIPPKDFQYQPVNECYMSKEKQKEWFENAIEIAGSLVKIRSDIENSTVNVEIVRKPDEDGNGDGDDDDEDEKD